MAACVTLILSTREHIDRAAPGGEPLGTKVAVDKSELSILGMGVNTHHYPMMFREACHFYFTSADYSAMASLYVGGLPTSLSAHGRMLFEANKDPKQLYQASREILKTYGLSLNIITLLKTPHSPVNSLFQQHRELVQLVHAYGKYTTVTMGNYQSHQGSGGGGGGGRAAGGGIHQQKTYLTGAGTTVGKATLGKLNTAPPPPYEGNLKKRKAEGDELGGANNPNKPALGKADNITSKQPYKPMFGQLKRQKASLKNPIGDVRPQPSMAALKQRIQGLVTSSLPHHRFTF